MQAVYYVGKGSHVRVKPTGVILSGVIRHFFGERRAFMDLDPGQSYVGPFAYPPGCACDHPHIEIDPTHDIVGVS